MSPKPESPAALQIQLPEPPYVGVEIDTTLGPGRLLYPIRNERWIVLIGTKGYTAEIEVITDTETDTEEATNGDTPVVHSGCRHCGADCTCGVDQKDID